MGNATCCQSPGSDAGATVQHCETLCGEEDDSLEGRLMSWSFSSEFAQEGITCHELHKEDCSGSFRDCSSVNYAISSSSVAEPREHGNLMLVAQCLSPVLLEIGRFFADRPKDIVPLFVLSARWLAAETTFCLDDLWERMYSLRWPAFYDAFRFNGARDWCRLYEDMMHSRCSCHLEVFEREKKMGFAMAAMPATVRYEGDTDTYVAKYISASEVDAEIIPCTENHRLRFCPSSDRRQLQPFFSHVEEGRSKDRINQHPSSWLQSLLRLLGRHVACRSERTSDDDLPLRVNDVAHVICAARQSASAFQVNLEVDRAAYPYKVLEGFEGLVVGEYVELQWKMQELSPFGWWCGRLDSLQRHRNSKTAIGTITFTHFPQNSSWYRLKVRFGDAKVRHCSFGGFSGGLRPVSDAEKGRWMTLLPQSAKYVAEMQERISRVA